MAMKKLPIGIQSFSVIRSGPWYYVDKTRYVKELVDKGKYYFLSRPRRFGKSLFLDTIRQAFLGRKEFFKGLYLYDHWDWDKNWPVIRISFGSGIVRSVQELKGSMESMLIDWKNDFEFQYEKSSINDRFMEAIKKASLQKGQRAVVLVDEYDKPILDNIERAGIAREIREELKNFYSVLKDADEFLEFVFITGVTKFSKVSLFSGLNQLQDITLHPAYATICGYTQHELEQVFTDWLEPKLLKKLKCWYNGYNWLGEKVYNPFDILLHLSEGEFRPYWFETGTPSFLIRLLMDKSYYLPNLESLKAGEELIGDFDVDRIYPENLLFQTGYLTIKEKIKRDAQPIYILGYPNLEVRVSLNDHLLTYLVKNYYEKQQIRVALYDAVEANDLNKIKEIFHSFFASIPYHWYQRNQMAGYEGYYASIVYAYFTASGLDVTVEDATSHGRIDMTIQFGDRLYVIEFKVVELDQEGKALEQIKSKRYWEKFESKANEIYIIGVEFSKESRNIVNFEWEMLNLY